VTGECDWCERRLPTREGAGLKFGANSRGGKRPQGSQEALALRYRWLGLVAVGLEPVEGVDGLGDGVAGATREAVGFAGETDEGGFDL
jgi:hypothetical protein